MSKLFFQNLKIRSKLLLIYFSCVLFPIILTDAIIIHNVNTNANENKKKDFEQVIERTQYNLKETVNGSIQFTNNLYYDRMLNNFLNKHYENGIDYYQDYMEMLENNNFSYNYNYGMLTKIEIFTDNETILSGGKIASINSAKDTDWYRAFKSSGKNILLHTYYDETKKFLPGSGSARTISIIRKLNNFGDNDIEKILKIDIDYNAMLMDVLNEKIDGELLVRNDHYILFSNIPGTSGIKPFVTTEELDTEKIAATRGFLAGGEIWEIVILSEKTPLFDIILDNQGLLALILLNIFLPTILIYLVGKSITQRLLLVSDYMNKVKKEHFEVITTQEGEDEIGNLIRSYNLMVLKIKELIEVVFKGKAEKQALELSNKQAELKAIQSQVNPHFLFNTLETIRMRSLIKNEEETAHIIGELALLFRHSMNWGSDFIKIQEEINFIEKYINIQKYRFGDKIMFYRYVMDDCGEYMIPKLAISSFIENAFVHGIETTDREGIISLTITKNDEFMFIEISDNGKGFDKNRLGEIRYMIERADIKVLNESKSTGVLNAYLRLRLFCDGNISFEIDSESGKGTDISIQMPLSYMKGNGS